MERNPNPTNRKTSRRIVAILVALFVVAGVAGAVFAATTAPTSAPDALAAWQEQRLADAKANLDARVEAGTLTAADADAIYARIEANVAACTATEPGTGTRSGTPAGGSFRYGRGGRAAGATDGSGSGAGAGIRARDGSGIGGGYGPGACDATTPAA